MQLLLNYSTWLVGVFAGFGLPINSLLWAIPLSLLWLYPIKLFFGFVFVFYLAGMNLELAKKAKGLRPEVKFLVAEWAIAGQLLNLILTTVFGTLMFLDLPREPAFSLRLGRYCSQPEYAGTWRHKLALKFAAMLNAHDFWGDAHIKGTTKEWLNQTV